MILYLVIGENNAGMGSNGKTWGICGIFRDRINAVNCPVWGFNERRIEEVETDLIPEIETINPDYGSNYDQKGRLKMKTSRMIRLD